MSRFSHYDTDEERLPEGMTRVGYDADTQVYTFQDADGSYWEGVPGAEYGRLTRVGADTSDDQEPFLPSSRLQQRVHWRQELMPLLNFGVLVGVCLLLLFWYLHSTAGSVEKDPAVNCGIGGEAYTIRAGDTCWAIAENKGIGVEEIMARNPKLACDALPVGSKICLPA